MSYFMVFSSSSHFFRFYDFSADFFVIIDLDCSVCCRFISIRHQQLNGGQGYIHAALFSSVSRCQELIIKCINSFPQILFLRLSAVQEILDPGVRLAFALQLIYLYYFHFSFLSVDRLAALSGGRPLHSVFTVSPRMLPPRPDPPRTGSSFGRANTALRSG